LPDIAIILLAAGHSHRFGASNKLLADYQGTPLISHAATALSTLREVKKVAVVGPEFDQAFLPEFETVFPDGGGFLQSDSIKTGMAAALRNGIDGVLICLADMPLVPASHFESLLACWNGPATLATTQSRGKSIPPALFGSDWFSSLNELQGDQGARDIIRQAKLHVRLADELAVDIDTLTDLQQLRLGQS
jgi:molybdenum cofactor cytidylyltransferase